VGRATNSEFPGESSGLLKSGGFHHKVAIANQGFCSAGEPEKHTFAAFIAGRELLSLPHYHIVRQAVLIVKDAIKTRLRDFLVSVKAIFARHAVPPAVACFQEWLNQLDVLEWSHRWPGKWRFSSGFRIIKISQNIF
jgi:hypothetical protein